MTTRWVGFQHSYTRCRNQFKLDAAVLWGCMVQGVLVQGAKLAVDEAQGFADGGPRDDTCVQNEISLRDRDTELSGSFNLCPGRHVRRWPGCLYDGPGIPTGERAVAAWRRQPSSAPPLKPGRLPGLLTGFP